jgi:hypothetical protein
MQANNGDRIVAPEVTLRIPGAWKGPEDFFRRLPRGYRCDENSIMLADGSKFELNALPADEEFPRIFAGSCPKLPTDRERDAIENYSVNICLTGRGGSIEAAKQLMAAGAAVLAAGGMGVFVDNSGIAHGATDWMALHDSADDGGVYWAYVLAARTDNGEMYSVGMHILGFADAIIPATGNHEYDARTLHSFLGYTAFSGARIDDGEVVGDVVLPTFRAYRHSDDRFTPDTPMFNPYGRWQLVPLDEERN